MEWLNPYHLQVASFVLINVILGVSIYVTLSTGQLSLGNAGFMSIGAYTAALLSTQHQLPIPVGILAGSLLAGAAGILVGIPSLRLSGVYLAIATLGFGEVLRAVLINWESLTGGAVGIAAIPQMGRVILAWARDRGFSPESLGLQSNQFISLTVFLILLSLHDPDGRLLPAPLPFPGRTGVRRHPAGRTRGGGGGDPRHVLQGAGLLPGGAPLRVRGGAVRALDVVREPGGFHLPPGGGDPRVRRLRRERAHLRSRSSAPPSSPSSPRRFARSASTGTSSTGSCSC